MMRLVPVAGVVCLVMLVAACADWSKPGGTPAALAADQSACDTQARAAYPPDLGPGLNTAGGAAPPEVACAPNRGCATTGGGAFTPGGALADRNADARTGAFNQCMLLRGWSK
jgi:hypothetical protein